MCILDSSVCFGSQESSSVCVHAPERALLGILEPLKGLFWLPEGQLRMFSPVKGADLCGLPSKKALQHALPP